MTMTGIRIMYENAAILSLHDYSITDKYSYAKYYGYIVEHILVMLVALQN